MIKIKDRRTIKAALIRMKRGLLINTGYLGCKNFPVTENIFFTMCTIFFIRGEGRVFFSSLFGKGRVRRKPSRMPMRPIKIPSPVDIPGNGVGRARGRDNNNNKKGGPCSDKEDIRSFSDTGPEVRSSFSRACKKEGFRISVRMPGKIPLKANMKEQENFVYFESDGSPFEREDLS